MVCGHGATVGALDKDQIFYAQARGIPKPQAEALLLEAFAGEIIDTIEDEPARNALHARLAAWLAAREV